MATLEWFDNDGCGFIPSAAVKVFPTAYRGTYEVVNDKNVIKSNINIESKLSTEFNLRHCSPTFTKDAYIIDWTNENGPTGEGLLTCFIKGYYFELKIKRSDLVVNENTLNYLCIKLEDSTLVSEKSTLDAQTTTILKSWHSVSTDGTTTFDTTLDFVHTVTNPNVVDYYFSGIAFKKEPPTLAAGSIIYYLDLSKSTASNKLPINTSIVESDKPGTQITKSLVDGTGINSIVQLYATTNDNSTAIESNIATAKNAMALGTGTTADKENLVVIGTYNSSAENNDLFIVGNGNNETLKNILQVNKNKVVITKTDDTDATFITTGKAEIAKDNAVELSATKKQTLVKGSLKSAESFTVGDDEKFTVTTDGNLTAKGTVTLGETEGTVSLSKSGSTTAIQGDLTVAGTASIEGKVDAKNGLAVTGNSLTVGDEKFTVTTDGDLTAEGNLIVVGTASIEGKVDAKNGLAVTGNSLTVGDDEKFTVTTDGNLTAESLKSTSNTLTLNTNNTFKLTANTTISAATSISAATTIKAATTISAATTINAATTISAPLIIGEGKNIGSVTISSAGTDKTTIYGPNNGALHLPADATTVNMLFKQDVGVSSWITYDHKATNNTIVQRGNAGEIYCTSLYTTSDKNKKENITKFIAKKSILDLPIYNYNFIGDNKKQIGCLAQDLQNICPELVTKNSDGILAINENKLVYLLLNEVKNLKQEINNIKK